MWRCVPAVPATQEAEVGGLFEPRSSGPAWATVRPSFFKNKKDKYKFKIRNK
jgi:hypothetical protein